MRISAKELGLRLGLGDELACSVIKQKVRYIVLYKNN
jgi:hypothetical protein